MFESARARQLAQLLAVLVGIVLLLPAFGRTLEARLAQPSSPALTCGDTEAGPVGKLEQSDIVPSESEVEEGEDSEPEHGFSSPHSIVPLRQLQLVEAGAVRTMTPGHVYLHLSARHHLLARERGPPLS